MRTHFEVITFDCYGTLIDWEAGIAAAFHECSRVLGAEIDRSRVLALHAEIEPVVQAGDFRSYREVLDITAGRVFDTLGWTLPEDQRGFLSASLPRWPPFADTGPVLRRVRTAGCRLGILSNVDDDLLAATLRHFPVGFDFLVTAEQVGAYKPALAHFREARRRIGDASWLHVAQSFFHDVQPAGAVGLPVVWINRKAELPLSDGWSGVQVPDLKAFADQVLGGGTWGES